MRPHSAHASCCILAIALWGGGDHTPYTDLDAGSEGPGRSVPWRGAGRGAPPKVTSGQFGQSPESCSHVLIQVSRGRAQL